MSKKNQKRVGNLLSNSVASLEKRYYSTETVEDRENIQVALEMVRNVSVNFREIVRKRVLPWTKKKWKNFLTLLLGSCSASDR